VQAADEARRAYDRLVASGRATQYDLERAWEAVLEAERRTRREGVSIWRAYVDQVIGLARGISKAFTDQILGINSTLHEEKKRAGSGVVALVLKGEDGKGTVAVGVTDDLTGRYSAAELVKLATAALGEQGGGGRPDMAQGGGPDGSKAEAAVAAVRGGL